ncbi:MAG: hypothetical protein IKX48_03315, partial [Victivallales bacterium]|nr:hypothetical protein [Victivallales bacterium]
MQPTDKQPNRRNKIITVIICMMLLLCVFGFVIFASRIPQETPPSEQPWMATTTEQDKAEATEIHDIVLNFRSVVIGDPITGAEYRYVAESSCWTWGITAAIICLASSIVFLKFKRKDATKKHKIIFCMCWTLISALIAFGAGYSASYYFGGPYNYKNYAVPTEPSDVLIWFSGSDDGAYFMDNYARSIHEFGYNCAALFNFRDIPQAIQFAEKLPEGSRIIVRGHSMGASAAFYFAEKCQREILLLDTRDPTSWFNHPKSKPSNVIHWRNVLPGEPLLRTPESRHMDTNYFCGFNMANVFRYLGGPWGMRN